MPKSRCCPESSASSCDVSPCLADGCLLAVSSLDLLTVHVSLSLYVPISLYKDTSVLLDLGLPLWPHFHLIYLLSFEVQEVRTSAYE